MAKKTYYYDEPVRKNLDQMLNKAACSYTYRKGYNAFLTIKDNLITMDREFIESSIEKLDPDYPDTYGGESRGFTTADFATGVKMIMNRESKTEAFKYPTVY